ncbi:hypothetical protein PV327_008912 [Microctonus hyperodae]|uniref:Uncharacterized protein n=1 Tax=Microctonus hyperodae TaxID=165561 RepID=A0AA39KV66_MICHY|nr:hypothetical protein PV327_008912 [Microctonus hyperodae]
MARSMLGGLHSMIPTNLRRMIFSGHIGGGWCIYYWDRPAIGKVSSTCLFSITGGLQNHIPRNLHRMDLPFIVLIKVWRRNTNPIS